MVSESITTGYTTTATCGTPSSTTIPCFKPLNQVTRQAVAAFLYRLTDAANDPSYTPPTSQLFTDVSPGHTFYAEIQWMAARHIDEGFTAGCTTAPCYQSTSNETRGRLITSLYNTATAPAAWHDPPPSNALTF
ncbi:hypothetical protein B7486_66985 [cyanobacterium TDX16]|nr:hypothetical protein B7486_66985 [cyanobacterium TDX16]